MEPESVRAVLQQEYSRLKRMKALRPPWHGLTAAVIDGHESHATTRQCCAGCLERTLHTKKGDKVQYYHRYVAMRLVAGDMELMLDMEPQRAGEDEVAAAMRLLERVLRAYPRAFNVIVADGLYARAPFFNFARRRGKHVMAVLKDEQRDLIQDARALFATMPPNIEERGSLHSEWWDAEGFTTWPQVHRPVRVVQSVEKRSVRQQIDGRDAQQTNNWFWVTTLPKSMASTRAVVELGHVRWHIENQGFNELVNQWHADHVYKHHPTAMLVLWLLAMACVNTFMAFYRRNLKAAARRAVSMLHVCRLAAAELYGGIPTGPQAAPT